MIAASRTFRARGAFAIVLAAVVQSGCANGPAAPPIDKVNVVAGGTAVAEPYRLEPGDDVTLRFQYYADLNDELTVGPDGVVNLQFIGSVKLAGLTVDEASEMLNQRFAEKIKEPTITVAVKTYSVQQIYVAGQVNNPGVIRDTVPLTLSRAIAEAGGVKLASATLSDVILVRRVADGSVKYYQLDLSNGVTATIGDPLLTSYDLVYVPETPIAQIADFVSNNLVRIVPYSYAFQYTQ